MAGNDSRTFTGVLKDGVQLIKSFFSPSSEDQFIPPPSDIGQCPQCHQPMLTSFNGCQTCMGFKVSPGFCNLPGCKKPRYFDGHTRRVHDFCGKTHAAEYRNQYMPQGHQHSYGHHHSHQHQQHQASYGSNISYGTGHNQNQRYQYGSTGHGYNTRGNMYMNQSGPINFYNRDEPYYEFTNFYPVWVHIDGRDWPTTEHYFQAQKFVGTPYVEYIRTRDRPREAFDISRDPQVSRWRRNDWEEIKVQIMYKALLAKFTQHPYLRDMLVYTGERELVEHTYNDSFWGDGGNGSGRNQLGKLLMNVRKELCKGKRVGSLAGTSVDRERVYRNTRRLDPDSSDFLSSSSKSQQNDEDIADNSAREKSPSVSPHDPPTAELVKIDDDMDTYEPQSSAGEQQGVSGEQQGELPLEQQLGGIQPGKQPAGVSPELQLSGIQPRRPLGEQHSDQQQHGAQGQGAQQDSPRPSGQQEMPTGAPAGTPNDERQGSPGGQHGSDQTQHNGNTPPVEKMEH